MDNELRAYYKDTLRAMTNELGSMRVAEKLLTKMIAGDMPKINIEYNPPVKNEWIT